MLPTPYLLSIHLAEQHDSFFASQAAQRMNVFRCLVEGCSSTFSSAAQRRQHLLDLHQIPLESCFDRYEEFRSHKPAQLPHLCSAAMMVSPSAGSVVLVQTKHSMASEIDTVNTRRIHLTLNQGQIRPSDNPARSKSDKSKPEPACEQPAVAPQVDIPFHVLQNNPTTLGNASKGCAPACDIIAVSLCCFVADGMMSRSRLSQVYYLGGITSNFTLKFAEMLLMLVIQVDTFVSTAVADASGAPTSSLSQSTDEHQATDAARQCNACLKAEDVAAGSPLQHPDTEQSPAQPHLPQYSKAPQTNQQTADGSSVQLDEPGGKHMAPHEKKSKGGRGAPLGGSGRGRGWGRHRVTLG